MIADLDRESVAVSEFEINVYKLGTFSLVAIICFLVIYLVKSGGPRSTLPRIIFLGFLVSVVWNYISLYQEEVAVQYMTQMKTQPAGCMEDTLTWTTALRTFFSSIFTFHTRDSDPCFKYASSVIINPIWKITPMSALLTTISQLFIHPATELAKGINKIMREMFLELPLFVVYYGSLIATYLATIVCIMKCAYAINIPFLFSFTPPAARPKRRRQQQRRRILGVNKFIKH
jgi:hypothetical protein